jgi:hypothetical protein
MVRGNLSWCLGVVRSDDDPSGVLAAIADGKKTNRHKHRGSKDLGV